MYSTPTKAQAAIFLANIAAGAEPPSRHTGLCCNLDYAIPRSRLMGLIPYYAQGWPEHSGYHYYPIPTGGDPAEDYYKFGSDGALGLWDSEQGELRRSLAKYVSLRLASEIGMQ